MTVSLPRFLPFFASLALVVGFSESATSEPQLQVTVNPSSPKLGESMAVIIDPPGTLDPQQADTLTVRFTKSGATQADTYPVFPLDPAGDRYRALIPTSPLEPHGKTLLQVSDGNETRNLAVWVQDRRFPTQRITLSGRGSGPATQYELDRVAVLKALVTPTKHWNGPFLRPNSGRVSTIFGVRRYYNGVFAQDYYHRGVDYAAGYGSPVVAPAPGKVALIDFEKNGFKVHGNTVGIDHGQGVISVFLHLNSIPSNLKEGDFVQAGQTIGTVGSSGASTGPHLHWGLYVNGVAIDPELWRNQTVQ
ncbi:peptidase [Picosynechococcus sp. PCC 7003]|uniref:M23 family metallopeptidase n=1 Tax=Picosynechococcus sp. PCC 7003 TaxID=374981 RepID=UPI0008103CE0|nr:M23 family metallopeptidase [Picosynechococcus sp. PCC 7003]ANV84327.1 peptidase [Picosynechococcus sp. PCC 7003]